MVEIAIIAGHNPKDMETNLKYTVTWIGKNVMLRLDGANLDGPFRASMLPSNARQLGHALIEQANEIDG